MAYMANNYSLLQQIYKDVSHFFDHNYVSTPLNLENILTDYRPYSDIDVDEVANAICWCANSLQALQNKLPIHALDEVLVFAESVLEKH